MPGKSEKPRKTATSKPKNKKTTYKKDYKPSDSRKEISAVKPAARQPKKTAADEIRLNKYIANSGVCSRREADIYIQSGNVKVNGEPITELGYKVKPTDKVEFDGVKLTPEKKVYVLLNKPKSFTTSTDEAGGQRNVNELIKSAANTPLYPIGRMDKTTTGLLLFTNDHDLINKFGSPNQRSSKIYQVSLDRNLKFEDLERIEKGVEMDGHFLRVDSISYIDDAPKSEIGLQVNSSNPKHVRAIFESMKYDVLKIDRVAFAGLTKKNLARGQWRFLTEQEIINLKNV